MKKDNIGKINIKTIADVAGVSTGTVSRVLNKTPGVKEKNRIKVEKVISDLKYEVDGIARSLRSKKTKLIGVVIGDILTKFYSKIVKAIENSARKYNYQVVLLLSDDIPERELKCLKILRIIKVDGIIISPTSNNASYINYCLGNDAKIVLLDRLIEGVNCDAILVENQNSAYKIVKSIIDQGYKKIGIVTGPLIWTSARERLNGYLRALDEAGIERNDNIIKSGPYNIESGIKLSREIFSGNIELEAIFTTNLDMLIGTIKTIRSLGLKVPDDIGLISFDDSEIAEIFIQPITTIRQPVQYLGATAVNRLIERIEDKGESKNTPLVITLKPELIIRNSTKELIACN